MCTIHDIIDQDDRANAYRVCLQYLYLEGIAGDIIEFGVSTGVSLAQLIYYNKMTGEGVHNQFQNTATIERTIIGVDSFAGLPDGEGHARWRKGEFTHGGWLPYGMTHPTIARTDRVTADEVYHFLTTLKLDQPVLIASPYNEIDDLPTQNLALVHIDCNLYQSTKEALNLINDRLQNVAIIMFDDWFCFCGDPTKGEQKAFAEFLQQNPHWQATEFLRYGEKAKAFLIRQA